MKEVVYFILPAVNKIGKIRAIEDSVFVFLEAVVTQIKYIGCMRHKRIGGVQVKPRMMIE
jgi:hypothetical protein